MSRRTYPRPDHQHAATASRVLARHATATGAPVALPVPIEMIVEQTFGLEILWEEIEEPPDTIILGALAPRDRRIVLNARHEAMFEWWIGPERFTLAHELAHWIYDAVDPDQLELDLDLPDLAAERLCYHRDSPELSDDQRIREVNANKLAAHLLLPEDLVRRANVDAVLGDIRGTAARWQVSQTALRIRLQDLGLIREPETAQRTLV